MALPKLTTILNKISTLPNIIRGQATEIKASFDHDSNVIKDYINNELIPGIEDDFATTEDLQALVIGKFGPNFATEAMMANEMKKDIAGGVASYNNLLSLLNAIYAKQQATDKNMLKVKMRQTGLNFDHNAWSDSLEDTSGINTSLSSGYYFDGVNKSIRASGGDIDSYTKLMLHCNGADGSTTFTDNSQSPKTVVRNGDTKISVSQSKFGGASGYFDGSGDYLSITNNADFDFTNGDFTIDLWVYPTAYVTDGDVIAKSISTSYSPFRISQDSSHNWIFLASSNGIGWDVASFSAMGTITLNTWQHLAVSRSGNTIRLFKNGVLGNTITTSATLVSNTADVNIGRLNYSTPSYFQGYIDEIRVSKGIARWTAAFTPPSSEYVFPPATIVWNAVTAASVLVKAVIESLETLGSGTITYYFSRDGGTTFTQCTLDTITSISAQPTGTSIVLKVVITGNAELSSVAWGGE